MNLQLNVDWLHVNMNKFSFNLLNIFISINLSIFLKKDSISINILHFILPYNVQLL